MALSDKVNLIEFKCLRCGDRFRTRDAKHEFHKTASRQKPSKKTVKQLNEFYARSNFSDLIGRMPSIGREAICCIVTRDQEQPNLDEPGSHASLHKHHLTDQPSKSPFPSLIYICEKANQYLLELRKSGEDALNANNRLLHPEQLKARAHKAFIQEWDAPRACGLSRLAFYVAGQYFRWCPNCTLPFALDALYYYRHRPDKDYLLLPAILWEIQSALAYSPKPNLISRQNQFLVLREMAGLLAEHGMLRDSRSLHEQINKIEERRGIDEEAALRRSAMVLGLSSPTEISRANARLQSMIRGLERRTNANEFLHENLVAGTLVTTSIFSLHCERRESEAWRVHEHLVRSASKWVDEREAPSAKMTAQNFFHIFLLKGVLEAKGRDISTARDSFRRALLIKRWLGLTATGEMWPGTWTEILNEFGGTVQELPALLAENEIRNSKRISQQTRKRGSIHLVLQSAGISL